jgi:cell division topological specificity factor MinE
MFLSKLFNKKKEPSSASLAKKRLMVEIEKNCISKDPYVNKIINEIESEIKDAIKKYVEIHSNKVQTNIEKEIDTMKLNCEVEGKKEIEKEDNFLNFFYRKKPSSASVAKDRLKFIISDNQSPAYKDQLEQDVKDIVRRLLGRNADKISIELRQEGDKETLELNISLPEDFIK